MRFSAWIYRAILLCYPDDLRLVFGDEMTDAFTEDLRCAWRERKVTRVAAVWWWAVREVVTIAIPGRLASPALSARAVSVALHIAVLVGILALGAIQEAMPSHVWHGVVELHLYPGRR